MSAWIVSRAHIDALVNAALPSGGNELVYYHEGDLHHVEDADKHNIGQMLIDECVKSVSYRYPDDDVKAGELPGPTDAYYLTPYQFRYPGAQLPAVWILSAINCYRYQSGEHPEWDGSEAAALVAAIEQRMIRKLPGYDDAPWGLEDEHVKPTDGINIMDMLG